MAFVAADWSITRSSKNIRYIGDAHGGASPSYATAIELHRALQDFADDQASAGDDELSIIDQTPSDRGGVDTNITLLNGYNIDQAASEHLYDGSITQAGGDEIYDGIQVFGNSNTIQVIQNGARLTNDFWNQPSMVSATSDAASSTTHRFMILVRDAGADINGRRLIGTQREYGTVYTEFSIGGGTNRGNNVLALNANPDLNNATASGTVATYTDIVNDNEGYTAIDADGNSSDEFYYSDWELGSRSKNDFYERMKYLVREGTSETLYGIDADVFRGITHEVDIDTPSGTFVEPEEVTWSTGTAQLLAVDSTTAGTKMWIQLLTGIAPTDGTTLTGTTSAATAAVDTTVVQRTVSVPFIGASTGTAIIGAFGVGIGRDDLTNSDLLIDLTNTPRTPPNNVTFTVGGLVATEDTIIVANNDGGDIDFDQLSLNATLNGASVTSVVVSSAIPTDTPASGTIRIQNDSGDYVRVVYTSYTGSTFTVESTDFSGTNAASGNNVFISYIDAVAAGTTLSFTSVYLADRTLFIRARDGGITPTKPFETTGTLSSAGGSTTIIRTPDA